MPSWHQGHPSVCLLQLRLCNPISSPASSYAISKHTLLAALHSIRTEHHEQYEYFEHNGQSTFMKHGITFCLVRIVETAGTLDDKHSSRDSSAPQPQADLPIREGAQDCRFYLRNGWCMFQHKCWYNHPPLHSLKKGKGKGKAQTAGDNNEHGWNGEYSASGMSVSDIYAANPGKPPCAYYMKHGWCQFKMKCR